MITIFPCGSLRPKGEFFFLQRSFLRLLVGELVTTNLSKFSPMANGYIHTEFYYTGRQIWTKDV